MSVWNLWTAHAKSGESLSPVTPPVSVREMQPSPGLNATQKVSPEGRGAQQLWTRMGWINHSQREQGFGVHTYTAALP